MKRKLKSKRTEGTAQDNVESQEIEKIQEKLRDMEDWIKRSNIKLIEVSEGNNGENRRDNIWRDNNFEFSKAKRKAWIHYTWSAMYAIHNK